MYLQKTIRERVAVEGIGLHSGKPARIEFCPAPANTGVQFVRSDLPGRPTVSARAHHVQATQNATTLGGDAFSVSTVEHCLSAVGALHLDNLYIELMGPEIPIGDGSALGFFEALHRAGVVEQDQARKYIFIERPIQCLNDEKQAYVVPYNGLRITCTIEFPHPRIGRQTLDIDLNQQSFRQEIAGARTFGFMQDVEMLRSKGLALGGSLENAVVLDANGILNPEGLRFADEFVRHKVLDAIGDLVTLGFPLLGHVVLYKAGHDMMNRLVQLILDSNSSYRFIEFGGSVEAIH